MDIKLIKPKKKGESDKYSWQLYQYIIKNYKYIKDLNEIKVYCNLTEKVYNDTYDVVGTKNKEFDERNLKLSEIIIGRMSEKEYMNDGNIDGYVTWYHGNTIGTILGSSREKYTVFANPWWSKNKVIDITEWFWESYIKLGKCLFDKNHNGWWQGDKDRFTYVNNTRRCSWCGQWQKKEIKKIVKIKREGKWINESK